MNYGGILLITDLPSTVNYSVLCLCRRLWYAIVNITA